MQLKKTKKRLDTLVTETYPHLTRNQVQGFIMQGKIAVDGAVVTKPGTQVATDAVITLTEDRPRYVSRAGFKLEAALQAFNIDVAGMVVLDAGISTGGFTDCLLQHGATRIYGVDVGYGQVHENIRNDARVVLLEKTNLRSLKTLPELIDLATLDLSFISLLKVMPAVSNLLKPNGIIIALIKPQFEADREDIGRGGLVKDDSVHQKVIENIKTGMVQMGFVMENIIESPILGAASGNKEFLALFRRQ